MTKSELDLKRSLDLMDAAPRPFVRLVALCRVEARDLFRNREMHMRCFGRMYYYARCRKVAADLAAALGTNGGAA